jgi:acid phosphatase family membrane protein YuiD
MNWFLDFLRNPFFLTAIAAWFTSQTLKIFTHAIAYKEWDLKRFFGDGGMPSSHTATVSSLAFFTGFARGFESFEFALALLLTMIVCRDAVGVRMETGKQTLIINELKKFIESKEIAEIKLKKFVGHTPLQVFFGLVTGFVVSILMFFVLLR